jgi:hypothetical protein
VSVQVVVLTPDDLTVLIEGAVRRGIAGYVKDALPRNELLTEPEVRERYRIGRRELRELIEARRLPATVRRTNGGESYLISTNDADRVLNQSI